MAEASKERVCTRERNRLFGVAASAREIDGLSLLASSCDWRVAGSTAVDFSSANAGDDLYITIKCCRSSAQASRLLLRVFDVPRM
jgi:hypothetical protein